MGILPATNDSIGRRFRGARGCVESAAGLRPKRHGAMRPERAMPSPRPVPVFRQSEQRVSLCTTEWCDTEWNERPAIAASRRPGRRRTGWFQCTRTVVLGPGRGLAAIPAIVLRGTGQPEPECDCEGYGSDVPRVCKCVDVSAEPLLGLLRFGAADRSGMRRRLSVGDWSEGQRAWGYLYVVFELFVHAVAKCGCRNHSGQRASECALHRHH